MWGTARLTLTAGEALASPERTESRELLRTGGGAGGVPGEMGLCSI